MVADHEGSHWRENLHSLGQRDAQNDVFNLIVVKQLLRLGVTGFAKVFGRFGRLDDCLSCVFGVGTGQGEDRLASFRLLDVLVAAH